MVDRFCFNSLLKASGRVAALREGREIHGLGVKMGFDSDPFVQTGLVGMYAACGCIQDARLVFDKMTYRDVVSWNIMIDGYGFSILSLFPRSVCFGLFLKDSFRLLTKYLFELFVSESTLVVC